MSSFSLFEGIAAASWATYAALVGFLGGAAFEDDPLEGVLLGLGLALSSSDVRHGVRRPAVEPDRVVLDQAVTGIRAADQGLHGRDATARRSGLTHEQPTSAARGVCTEIVMSSSSTGRPPRMGSTAAQLAYRAFTATRAGLATQAPPGHESLMWVANSATLIYGKRDAALVDTFLTIDQGVDLADRIAAGGKNLTRRLFPGEIPGEPGMAESLDGEAIELALYPDRANPGPLWGVANAAKREAGNGVPGTATAARREQTAATGGAS